MKGICYYGVKDNFVQVIKDDQVIGDYCFYFNQKIAFCVKASTETTGYALKNFDWTEITNNTAKVIIDQLKNKSIKIYMDLLKLIKERLL